MKAPSERGRRALPLSLLGFGLIFLAHRVEAVAPIDPAVVDVRSGGLWEEESQGGFYRIVVWHSGTEEVKSAIALEWIAYQGRDEPSRVTHSIAFATSLLGFVKIDSFLATKQGARIALSGPLHDGPRYHCVVFMEPRGTYKKAAGC